MLTQQEENVLRQLARDHAPSVVVNPQVAHLPDEASGFAMLLDRWRTAGPLRVVSGCAPTTDPDGKLRPVVGEDQVLLEKTKHVRRKDEKMMQFFARTGIGKSQILSLTKDELARLVAVASQNEGADAPSNTWTPQVKTIPRKLCIIDTYGE